MRPRKLASCTCSLLFALLAVCPALASAETAQKQSQTPAGRGQNPRSPLPSAALRAQALSLAPRAKSALQTPFQRILEPHLRQMYAGRPNANVLSRSGSSLQSHLQSNGSLGISQQTVSGDPNFGGFFAAPSYPTVAGSGLIGDGSLENANPVVATLAADVNKDGFPDLIAIQYNGAFSVLLNNGHGGFAAPVVNTSAQTAGAPVPPGFGSAVVTDLNHDGYPDLVALDGGQNSNNELWVFLNQGNGTFAAPVQIPFQPKNTSNGACTTELEEFAVGDVTGDGNPDLVAVGSCGPILTYAGNGKGGFNTVNVPETDGVNLVSGSVQLQVIGGKLSLAYFVIASYNPHSFQAQYAVAAQPSNGDGTFGTANTLTTLSTTTTIEGPLSFQFQDLNGDGVPDLAINDLDGNFYVALGNSDGSFQAPMSTVGGNTVVSPRTFALVDVNGDNLPDFLDVEAGFVSVYLNNGDGTFGGPSGIAAENYSVVFEYLYPNLAVSDFNGDGKADFAFTDFFYDRASIYFGNGDGSFQGAPQIAESSPTPAIPAELQVTTALDVNGDGKQDILVADEGNNSTTGVLQIQSGIGDGKGNFTYKTALSGSSIYNLEDILTQTGDFNGDGLQDILLYSTTSSGAPVISVSLSNGDGTFQHPVAIRLPNAPLQLPANVAVGDVNGDGKQDLVIAYEGDGPSGVASGYYVALGNGDGTFQQVAFTAYGSELYLPLLADVNGDGNLDLVLVDNPVDYDGSFPFQVTVLLGDGKGAFSSGIPLTLNTSNLIENAFVSDLNKDGKQDVVLFTGGQVTVNADGNLTAIPDTEGVLVLLNEGDGSFNTSSLLAQGIEPVGGAVADFNGDGIPDILFSLYNDADNTSQTYYGVSTLLGNGDGTFTLPSNGNAIVYVASYPILTGNFLGDNTLGVVAVGGDGSSLLLNEGGTRIALSAASTTMNAGEEETLTATVTPSVAAQPATPTGTVTFLIGSTVLGQGSLAGGTASLTTAGLPIGSDTITVSYSGDSSFNAYASAASVNIKVAPALTATTVNASPDPAAPGATVTLQATVAPAASGTPTGLVTFYDGSTQLGTGTLANGSATYTTSSLAAGNHSITATYAGDSNFAGSTSNPVTELIEAPAVSLSVNPTALTMTAGQNGTVTLTIGANAAYSGSINLSATGAPANTSVSFNPNSLTLAASQTQLVTVTITTNTSTTASASHRAGWAASGGAGLAGLVLILLPRRRRRLSRMLALITAIASLVSFAAVTGCGGGSSTTPKGNSVLTITATPSGSGTAVQTTLNLIVQ